MSILAKIENRLKEKFADVIVMFITKIVPLVATYVGGFFIAGSVDTNAVRLDRLQHDNFSSLIENLFLLSFFMALVAAVVCRFAMSAQNVSVPMGEEKQLRRIFSGIWLLGFIIIIAVYTMLTASIDISLVRSFVSVITGQSNSTALFWVMLIVVTAVVYLITYSILCFWLLPRPLQVMAQPGIVRWLPRFLARFEFARI